MALIDFDVVSMPQQLPVLSKDLLRIMLEVWGVRSKIVKICQRPKWTVHFLFPFIAAFIESLEGVARLDNLLTW